MSSTQIRLHNVRPPPGFARRIRARCEALHRFHPDLGHCRVTVERPSCSLHPVPVDVTILLDLPGREVVVGNARNLDANLAVREAFDAARRCLSKEAEKARERAEA